MLFVVLPSLQYRKKFTNLNERRPRDFILNSLPAFAFYSYCCHYNMLIVEYYAIVIDYIVKKYLFKNFIFY